MPDPDVQRREYQPRARQVPLKHNHSRWEPCVWYFKCPVANDPHRFDKDFHAYYPDSDPKPIVINGVVFKIDG